jgi:hypothetical protein
MSSRVGPDYDALRHIGCESGDNEVHPPQVLPGDLDPIA